MAQLVARLVRNEKVGGSNPPSSTTDRHPIRMSVFCMPGCVVAVLCGPTGVPGAPLCCFVGPGCSVCPWAAARPRAVRAASLRLGASSRSPARPRHRPQAPHPGPCLEARSGPPPPTGTAARLSGPSTSAAPAVLWGSHWSCRHAPGPRPGPVAAHRCGWRLW